MRFSTRVTETRERYESPHRQIDGNGNPHSGVFGYNQSYRVIELDEPSVKLGRNETDQILQVILRSKY